MLNDNKKTVGDIIYELSDMHAWAQKTHLLYYLWPLSIRRRPMIQGIVSLDFHTTYHRN